MTIRKFKTPAIVHGQEPHKVTYHAAVYWVADWEEFQARVYINNRELVPSRYHTNDFEDACNTARDMAQRVAAQGLADMMKGKPQ
ncbi:hypothetical protein IB275_30315 [Pseudomonas sp. PDM21]|uniref:hypothetical protein n=1 Tax=Pseudomonas sp. PDM21 TaxID=2769257 RepID=UPI0017870210|nr:hypothetical protein [Pseudomonas sp. PDM21]MBD9674910.1 hypothetical protein [Pseudomonas sp. PDM21]